jgi:hypothetical protein
MARIESQAIGGYYPTPAELLPLIISHVSLPSRSFVFDPCAGEGDALAAWYHAMTAAAGPGAFQSMVAGCELERTRAHRLATRPEAVGNSRWRAYAGDAFCLERRDGAKPTVLYLNPPYDLDPLFGRLEHRFLERFTAFLCSEGALVFVVPGYALKSCADLLAARYEQFACFRFPGEHYAAFKQVVLFATRLPYARTTDSTDFETARATVLKFAEDPENLPELTLATTPTLPVTTTIPEHMGNTPFHLKSVDYKTMALRYQPWTLRSGTVTATSPVKPPAPSELGFRLFPSAVPPKPAHLAAGIASGVFDGMRLRPDDVTSGLPDILVKGVFDREFVAVEEKRNKTGELVSVVEVQQPRLQVTALDLSTGVYHTLRSSVETAGKFDIAKATTADLLQWYSKDLLRALVTHCPVLHNPANPAHQIALAPTKRTLYPAQVQATQACVKLLGGLDVSRRRRRGKAALLLGEVGSGKTTVALTAAATIKARKVLVMVPPHLLDGWTAQAREVFGDDVTVHVLSNVTDVDAFAALEPSDKKLAVALVTREVAKLTHGFEDVEALTLKGRRTCAHCGATLRGKPGEYSRRRLHCEGVQRTAEGFRARLAVDLFHFLAPYYPEAMTTAPGVSSAYSAYLARRAAIEPEKRSALPALSGHPRWRGFIRRIVAHAQQGHASDSLVETLSVCLRALNDRSYAYSLFAGAVAALSPTNIEHWTHDARDGLRKIARCLWSAGHTSTDNADADLEAAYSLLNTGWYDRGPWQNLRAQLTAIPANESDARLKSVLWSPKPLTAAELRDQCIAMQAKLAELGRWHAAKPCGAALYQATATPRRVSLAQYIAKKYPNLADVLVLDEAHELATDGSAQERAGHRLAALGWPTLYLTGSIMNGYSESLFANFWHMSAKFRDEFRRDQRGAFVDRYGYIKRVVSQRDKETKQPVVYGSQSDRVERTERDAGVAPGILPLFVLRHLLPVAVTLHKADLNLGLPPCVETSVPIQAEAALASAHTKLKDALIAEIRRTAFTEDSGKLWGALASLPSHLDRASVDTGNVPSGAYEITYPDGRPVAAAAPVYGTTDISPKEAWLLAKVQAELAEGRRVMVLTYHLNVMPRLARLLTEHLKEKVAVLYADKVPTAKREAWITKEVIKSNVRVLLANPTTIQTGLNNLVWFATQVWHENPACNPLVYRQAMGRIDRPGQTLPTRVFFPYFADTTQAMLRDLLARKVSVSMSTDGIDPESAMAAAGMSQDLTLAALSVGRQLFQLLDSLDA